MAKITPITEQFQHFLAEMKESFWGDLYGRTQQAWKQYFELESERLRDRYSGLEAYERRRRTQPDYRNGYYERDFVTRFGSIRLRIARTRKQNFLPPGRGRISPLPQALARTIPGHGAATGARPAGVAELLQPAPPSVEKAAPHQHIERCLVEVRRRTRPMVCFVNVASVDRIIFSIFHRFNLEWKTRTLRAFTQAA